MAKLTYLLLFADRPNDLTTTHDGPYRGTARVAGIRTIIECAQVRSGDLSSPTGEFKAPEGKIARQRKNRLSASNQSNTALHR